MSTARKQTAFRLSEVERGMMKQLAEHMGISHSDLVRQLVRQAHTSLFGLRYARADVAPKRKAARR
jgi:predicted DNA-binding protein